MWSDEVESAVLAAYTASKGVRVVSWEVLREAGIADPQYVDLLHKVGSGCQDWTGENLPYQKYVEDLSVVDGVVTFKGRAVVPHSMREEVLKALHRAHQGSTSMSLRASETVWWPGVGADIGRVRENCLRCRQNAPSQQPAPPKELPVPAYPFQLISSDYFSYSGKTYLVVVDRYSGWPTVLRCREDSADELIRQLRNLFCVHGVPEELASDGASVYVAAKTRAFLELWGVRHRMSSAYHPHSNLRAETCEK